MKRIAVKKKAVNPDPFSPVHTGLQGWCIYLYQLYLINYLKMVSH